MTGSAGLAAPDRAQDVEPVAAGQHHVEHHEVQVAFERAGARPSVPVVGDVDRVALRVQPPLHEVRDAALVFDHQDPHRAIVRPVRRSR